MEAVEFCVSQNAVPPVASTRKKMTEGTWKQMVMLEMGTREWAEHKVSLRTGGRGSSIPEFWLPRCLRNMKKFCKEHILQANTERSFALLKAESVEGTTGLHYSLTSR